PCGLSQMIALRYGTIPIVRETGGLKDSIQDSGDGEGNGFTFHDYSSVDMDNAVRRALQGYQDQEGWKILVQRAMRCNMSWGKSANEYIRLYRDLLKE
ncbi:MAG TPA: starch synthase, partial [Ruminococcaceae bacterium]|nr:starch synthase [Oscillospiraceae bacterium]